MAAPVQDDTYSGGFGGASSHAYAPTYVGRTSELFVIAVCYEQANGTANSLTSITDSNGLTWTRKSTQNFTGGTTGNITAPAFCALEIWWAQGTITAGAGTLTMNFSAAVDHSCFVGLTYHGHNATQPFDQSSTLAQTFSGNATPATPSISGVSTRTSNVVLFGAIGTQDNASQTGILFNGGVSDVGLGTSFSSGGTNFCFVRAEGKASTSGFSGETVAGNTSRANQIMCLFAITADVNPATPLVVSHGVSIC